MSLRPYIKTVVVMMILAVLASQGFAQAQEHAAAATEAASGGFNKAFAVGIVCFGVAIGVASVGISATSAVGRNPGASGEILKIGIISMAMVEAIAFYVLFLL